MNRLRLDLRQIRRALAQAESGREAAPKHLSWPSCALPRSLAEALRGDPPFRLRFDGEAALVPHALRRALRARLPEGDELPGGTRAVVAEGAFLARFFAGLIQQPVVHVLAADRLEALLEALREGGFELALVLGLLPEAAASGEAFLYLPGPFEGHPRKPHRQKPAQGGLWLAAATRERPWFVDGDEGWAQEETTTATTLPPTEVVLVSTPFADLQHPSIGLSLLSATLTESPPRDSPRVETLYLALPFAEEIGPEIYRWIGDGHPAVTCLLGEWLFSAALGPSPPCSQDEERYLDAVVRPSDLPEAVPESAISYLKAVRGRIDGILDRWAAEILARRPRLVGFSSVFQQHVASLALARRLRQRDPDIFLLFGGANCEGPMGLSLLRSFEAVDAVVSGEGEKVIRQVVERVLAAPPGAPVALEDLTGVYTQRQARAMRPSEPVANAPSIRQMDELPRPCYDDFYRQWRGSSLGEAYPPRPLLETSRGCWWGEKHHCTFCGLNGAGMAYRSKSPERVLEELGEMVERYAADQVSVVDNILDMRYLTTLVPELTRRKLDVKLFYEVKANLRRDQLVALREAGIRTLQPGLESLSTEVLRRMRKGVTALQNIQLLKWCKELGIAAYWNLLWGVPGEPEEEYEQMAELVPWLTHLNPPSRFGPFRVDRFSPNFFQAADLGLTDLRPVPAYRHLFPSLDGDLEHLAYYFDYGYRKPQAVERYTAPLGRAIERWQDAHPASELVYVDRDGHLALFDFRPAARSRTTVLTGAERRLYLACDRIRSLSSLGRQLGDEADRVEELLQPLLAKGLAIRDGQSALALAVPLASPNR